MRNWLSVLLVALGMLVGYAFRGNTAEAQTAWLSFTTGDTLLLRTEDTRQQVRCAMTQAQNTFIACKDDRGRGETWYNLRFVSEITKPER